MAVLGSLNGEGKYKNEDAKELVAEYILDSRKTISGYIGGYAISPECPAQSMMLISEQFKKSHGVQLRHFVLAFSPYELTDPAIANEIGIRIAQLIGREYQVLYAVHENCDHLHIHIMANSVSYIDGHRYSGKHEEYSALKKGIHNILRDYGIKKLI